MSFVERDELRAARSTVINLGAVAALADEDQAGVAAVCDVLILFAICATLRVAMIISLTARSAPKGGNVRDGRRPLAKPTAYNLAACALSTRALAACSVRLCSVRLCSVRLYGAGPVGYRA